MSRVPLLSGGTISGSGKVRLILDPAALVRAAERRFDRACTEPVLPSPTGRALIVDDSRTAREALAAQLRDLGIDSDQCDCAESAMERLEATHYALLVTDVEMPGRNGIELVQELRHRLQNVTVVVVSSQVPEAWMDAARRAGAHHCLPKPVAADALRTIVESRDWELP